MKKYLAIVALAMMSTTALAQKDTLKFIPEGDYANSIKILPAPPKEGSAHFLYDQYQYFWGKQQRETPRGKQAYDDAAYNGEAWARDFSGAYGIEINDRNTPELMKLFRSMWNNHATSKAKRFYHRTRPFVYFNQPSLVPEDEAELRKNGSYPSGHTNIGTALGLIMAEVNVANQDSILKRAWEYGQSRVIAGYHWQSDVDAGRFIGAAWVARLHADATFCEQLKRVKAEFRKLDKAGRIKKHNNK